MQHYHAKQKCQGSKCFSVSTVSQRRKSCNEILSRWGKNRQDLTAWRVENSCRWKGSLRKHRSARHCGHCGHCRHCGQQSKRKGGLQRHRSAQHCCIWPGSGVVFDKWKKDKNVHDIVADLPRRGVLSDTWGKVPVKIVWKTVRASKIVTSENIR